MGSYCLMVREFLFEVIEEFGNSDDGCTTL